MPLFGLDCDALTHSGWALHRQFELVQKTCMPKLMEIVEIEYLSNPELPGIYIWQIEDIGCYVGKYTSKRRPLMHYARNVSRLLNNQPYRKNNPNGWRYVHVKLAEALQEGKRIRLIFFENVPIESLSSREKELIIERGDLNR